MPSVPPGAEPNALKADAEDVYQDVFMRLYGDATEFTSSEHLKAWLRVTINRCRDLAKSNWNRHAVALDPRTRTTSPSSCATRATPTSGTRWASCPTTCGSSVHLHYVEGYTTDEIARMLHSQPATVRTWLSRARAGERPVDARKRADGSACRASVRRTRPSHTRPRKEVPHD